MALCKHKTLTRCGPGPKPYYPHPPLKAGKVHLIFRLKRTDIYFFSNTIFLVLLPRNLCRLLSVLRFLTAKFYELPMLINAFWQP
ncbi:hypothetical protein B6F84_10565 [Acidianus manzaensis]|uniref:Uncharacterized protein n=1 Tax=Acidianus manzaensis TaxID=282676 RepID=A0A1W6K1N5_9CREN|nr:hypothetical protein B6F84_10565 [Acidianus manzaensis]